MSSAATARGLPPLFSKATVPTLPPPNGYSPLYPLINTELQQQRIDSIIFVTKTATLLILIRKVWKKGVDRQLMLALHYVTFEKEEVLVPSQIKPMDKASYVVLDIENLTQPYDKCCSGSPKMTKALSRKGSSRMERQNGEEQESDEASKKLLIKVVSSQLEQSKQSLVPNKAQAAAYSLANNPMFADQGDGRNKRFNRLTTIHPRRILLLFATVSSMGTMILIYFTLAINRRGGA